MRGYRRRNYFTRKGFQSRFILRFLIVSSVGVVFAVALFNILARAKLESLLFSMRLPSENVSRVIIPEALAANIAAVVFVAFMFAMTARAVYTRIKNSLFRIRTDLSRLGRGDLSSKIILQSDEEFKDFADELNIMITELNHRFSSLKNHLNEISRETRELRRKALEPESHVLKEDIERHVDALSKELEEFRV